MAFFNSKSSKLYLHYGDVTAYLKEVSGLPNARPVSDITSLADSGFKGIPSIENGTITLDGMFNPAGLALDEVLDNRRAAAAIPNGIGVVTHWPGLDTAGRYGYASEFDLGSYETVSRVGDLVVQRATLQSQGPLEHVRSIEAKQTVTASQNGASVDDSASSANGGSWFFHIFVESSTGGNEQWQIELQDSPDDSAWATLSAGGNVTGVKSERLAFTGTVDRHVRIVITRDATSGSLTFSAGYNRAGVF